MPRFGRTEIEQARNWLCAKYIGKAEPYRIPCRNGDVLEFRLVRYDDFAEYLLEINAHVIHTLDHCTHRGWICGFKSAPHVFDSSKHTCVLDSSTAVGRDFTRLFLGFARREFGDDFAVERLDHMPRQERATAAIDDQLFGDTDQKRLP